MLIKQSFPGWHGFNYFSLYNAMKKVIVPLLLFTTLQVFTHRLAAQLPVVNISPATRALFQEIRSGSTGELEKQLASGASTNDSLNNYSALMAAVLSGTPEQMKILIDHGANVNYTAQDGTNALWLSVPDWDKTKLLVDYGADVKHTIGGYGILVKLASIPGTIKVFRFLMDKGAEIKKSGPDNMLLYNAAMSGDTTILGFLIRLGLAVNDTVFFGDHPINAAMAFRTSATLKMLVDNGADVNVAFKLDTSASYSGMTPLMLACVYNDKLSFFYLLEHGANPNLKNNKGYTALMLLQQSEKDDPEMTMALLNHGAEPTAKTNTGNDALHFAMQKGNTGSVEILKKYANK